MIEGENHFPTDTIIEKIASALRREPCELFAIDPIKTQCQENLLAELAELITEKLKTRQKKDKSPKKSKIGEQNRG
jgi:hypothetical protein